MLQNLTRTKNLLLVPVIKMLYQSFYSISFKSCLYHTLLISNMQFDQQQSKMNYIIKRFNAHN